MDLHDQNDSKDVQFGDKDPDVKSSIQDNGLKVTLEQMAEMNKFMTVHPVMLRKIKFPRKTELWEELTAILNQTEGPKKNWIQWLKLWSHWKYRLRRRAIKLQNLRRQGKDPDSESRLQLTKPDIDLLKLLSEDFILKETNNDASNLSPDGSSDSGSDDCSLRTLSTLDQQNMMLNQPNVPLVKLKQANVVLNRLNMKSKQSSVTLNRLTAAAKQQKKTENSYGHAEEQATQSSDVISSEQQSEMVNFLSDHPQMVSPHLTVTNQGLLGSLWLQLTKKLNDLPGPTRSTSAWIKEWNNWKVRVKVKVDGMQSIYEAGGEEVQMTPMEAKIMNILVAMTPITVKKKPLGAVIQELRGSKIRGQPMTSLSDCVDEQQKHMLRFIKKQPRMALDKDGHPELWSELMTKLNYLYHTTQSKVLPMTVDGWIKVWDRWCDEVKLKFHAEVSRARAALSEGQHSKLSSQLTPREMELLMFLQELQTNTLHQSDSYPTSSVPKGFPSDFSVPDFSNTNGPNGKITLGKLQHKRRMSEYRERRLKLEEGRLKVDEERMKLEEQKLMLEVRKVELQEKLVQLQEKKIQEEKDSNEKYLEMEKRKMDIVERRRQNHNSF